MVQKISVNKSSRYHPELISMYLEGIIVGIIVGNMLVSLAFIYEVQAYVPHYLLVLLALYAFSISLYRFILARALKKKNITDDYRDRYIRYTIYSTALNGMMWAYASVLTYLYAPSEYMFFTTTLVMGIVSGAITSLTPIYQSFVAYVVFAVIPLNILFFLMNETMYTAFSFLIIFFTFFIVYGGRKHHNKLYEAILLKDRLKLLNEDLEGEVKVRTLELEVLNSSLEDKVAQEIDKNREKEKYMIEHSRMAQMGEMISMIAHQWRQPLGAIASTSIDLRMQMMLESYDLNDKAEQKKCISYMDSQLIQIEGYVQDLTQTIDDFRNFYKPNKNQKVCSINDPIQKALSIIKATAESEGTETIEDYKSTERFSLFDSELMQVFLNIIKNAIDNFKEQEIRSGKITITTKDIENGVHVEVCDNGGGIPQEIKSKIYDPYFSTKSEKNGTGLGLYMSKTIVEEHHNGTLDVVNKDGGACFIVKIYKNS